ncbi:MAG: histidine kinase, partial [Burkholderiaceae bacterium]
MSPSALDRPPATLPRIFSRPRLWFALLTALPFGLMIGATSTTAIYIWLIRVWIVALAALLAFGVLERWPAQLSPKIARWVLQLLGVVIIIPFATYAAFWITTGEFYFMTTERRRNGFFSLAGAAMFFAPWLALTAMLRQREAFARDQALAFELERSEFERKMSDARLRLLQTQVQPHFLFNTLANVRALVDAGSPQAAPVL